MTTSNQRYLEMAKLLVERFDGNERKGAMTLISLATYEEIGANPYRCLSFRK